MIGEFILTEKEEAIEFVREDLENKVVEFLIFHLIAGMANNPNLESRKPESLCFL